MKKILFIISILLLSLSSNIFADYKIFANKKIIDLPNNEKINENKYIFYTGNDHIIGIKNGTIVGWGSNQHEQGSGIVGTDYIKIDAGNFSNLALKNNGSIVGWGRDFYGETSSLIPEGNFIDVAMGGYHGAAVKSSGEIVVWGEDNYGNNVLNPPTGNNYKKVYSGTYFSIAQKNDGSLKGWGQDNFNQISDIPIGTGFSHISLGFSHALAFIIQTMN